MIGQVPAQAIPSAAQRRNAAQSHGILRRPLSDAEYMPSVPYEVADSTPPDAGIDSCSRDHSPGLTNRRGGKRWTGPRPLAVPPCQPTSRRADQLGGIRSRLFPIFLSSRHPPRQRPHHQGQPGEGPDRQYDRAVRQEFHAGEDAA